MTRTLMGVACAAWSMGIGPQRSASGQAAPIDSAAAIAVLRSTCGADAARDGTGLLRGEVRDSEAKPV